MPESADNAIGSEGLEYLGRSLRCCPLKEIYVDDYDALCVGVVKALMSPSSSCRYAFSSPTISKCSAASELLRGQYPSLLGRSNEHIFAHFGGSASASCPPLAAQQPSCSARPLDEVRHSSFLFYLFEPIVSRPLFVNSLRWRCKMLIFCRGSAAIVLSCAKI
jgi:hypothetical protein